MKDRQPMTLEQGALDVVRLLRDHGHEAFWAGGCVRDMLMGRTPADIDVATNATPDEIAGLFRRTRKVGAKFGVVMVRQGPYWYETATFRADLDYEDGRRPTGVTFTTAERDAQRRDFTINGLFYDPVEQRVIDYVDGQRDLQAGVIRAIGEPEERFAEDHLRMLRAVRFAERLGFAIEPATANAIRNHAGHLPRISPERIREELEKMLAHPARSRAFAQLAELDLLGQLWPDAAWSPEQITLISRILQALPEKADFTLSLAAMLHDRSLAEVTRAARDLRCSNQVVDDTAWLVGSVDAIHHAADLALPAFKRLLAHPRFDDLLALHHACCAARGLPLDASCIARERSASIPSDQVAPPPFVTGDDLISRGLQPGPEFKRILDRLYEEQLDEQLTTRKAAFERLDEILVNADKPPD